ncbi:MAG: type II toxin-antitoxin system VapC family toxin [Isosphaeraceae bacterium]
MNKVLLDTDIYSEILKASNTTVTHHATVYRRAQGVLTLSSVTVMEIVRGFQRKQSFLRLQSFLNGVSLEEMIPFDRSFAEVAGRIAGELDVCFVIGRPRPTGLDSLGKKVFSIVTLCDAL